jgi:hypothetical protein
MNKSKQVEDNIEAELAKLLSLDSDLDESETFTELEEDNSLLKEQLVVNDRKTVMCKKCRDYDVWTCTELFPNGQKQWRDRNGLITNGRICGSCNKERSFKTMRVTRSKDRTSEY